jgi:hypothetical protein
MRISHEAVAGGGVDQARMHDRSIQFTASHKLMQGEACAVQGVIARALRRTGQHLDLALKRSVSVSRNSRL